MSVQPAFQVAQESLLALYTRVYAYRRDHPDAQKFVFVGAKDKQGQRIKDTDHAIALRAAIELVAHMNLQGHLGPHADPKKIQEATSLYAMTRIEGQKYYASPRQMRAAILKEKDSLHAERARTADRSARAQLDQISEYILQLFPNVLPREVRQSRSVPGAALKI